MAAKCSSSSRFMSSGPILLPPKGYRRPVSPSERCCSSIDLNYSSTSRGSFSSRAVSQQLPSRPQVMSVSPCRRSSMDLRPMSPCNQVVNKENNRSLLSASQIRRACVCSPSTHPGAFRCMLHRKLDGAVVASNLYASEGLKLNLRKSPSDGLNLKKYAITNCIVRKDTVKEESVKKALKDLIRPSTCDARRRKKIQLRPSRLSLMLKNEED